MSNVASNAEFVSRLTVDEYLANPAIQYTPAIIRNIVSSGDVESLTDELMSAFSHEIVRIQERRKKTTARGRRKIRRGGRGDDNGS
jgi:hypothetical protein